LKSLVGTLRSLSFANAQAAGNTPHSPRKYFYEEMICDMRKRERRHRGGASKAALLPGVDQGQ
jgi:hypothetical protein